MINFSLVTSLHEPAQRQCPAGGEGSALNNFDLFPDETSDSVQVSEQCCSAAAIEQEDQEKKEDTAATAAAADTTSAGTDQVAEADQPKPEVSEEKVPEEIETKPESLEEPEPKIESGEADMMPEEKEKEALPPPPPKRSSQTNQRLKRWSRMLKHSLPNKLPKVTSSGAGSTQSSSSSNKDPKISASTSSAVDKDRKSLKEKVLEGELAVFLKERRAVSESRFRILDKLTPSSGVTRPPLPRTKSNDLLKKPQPVGGRYIGKVRRTSGGRSRTWGNEIQPGTLSNLKEIFESKSASCSPTRSDLRSPSLLKEMLASQEKINETGKRDFSPVSKANGKPGRLPSEERQADIKKMQVTVTVHPVVQSLVDDEKDFQDTSTTSPESGQEDQKRKEDGGREKKKKTGKDSKKDPGKKEKKEKKERKKHSTCEACNSDREHREHKKEKKRAKKEKEKKEKGSKKVTIMNGSTAPNVPPHPNAKDYNWDDVDKGGFFKKLLIHEGNQTPVIKSLMASKAEERKSRPRKSKSPVLVTSKPTLNSFLKERKNVSDSKFKKDAFMPHANSANLPPGVIQGYTFFENRSKFESGLAPVAKFPRSISNLERRSGLSQDGAGGKEQNGSTDQLLLPSRSVSAMSHRSSSLPRPISGHSHHSEQSLIDHEEYKNYMLEMLHSTQKSARFQQLQSYYNILERAKQLEKKSSSMEIHKLKSDEVIDFETWRKLRQKEKAKDELQHLMRNLKQAQKEGQFHFCPKEIDEVRWKGDIRLRGRDKSVENLRNHFATMAGHERETKARQDQAIEPKDTYKPLWRAKSVASVASKIQQNQKQPSAKVGKLGENKFTTFPGVKAGRSSGRSRSSLTNQQVNILKDQLKGIYETGPGGKSSTMSSVASSEKLDSSYEVSITKNKLGEMKKQLELQNLFVKPLPKVVQQSRRQEHRNKQPKPVSRESSAEERQRIEEQRTISHKIGQELMERSALRFDLTDSRKPIKFTEKDDQPPQPQQQQQQQQQVPRTCYSFENGGGDANPCHDVHDEDDDFLLVLTDADSDEQQDKEVKTIVDHWASGDEGGKSGKRRRHASSGKKSADSFSSATTANTVVQNKPLQQLTGKKAEDFEEPFRSFEELKKSFENVNSLCKSEEDLNRKDSDEIPAHLSVRTIRKSFEKLNDQPETAETGQPKTPARSSSFYRARYIGQRTKSPSSELPAQKTFQTNRIRSTDRQKFFRGLERSLSNPDFSDTEGASSSKKNFQPWNQSGKKYYTNPRPSHSNNNSSLAQLIETAPAATKYSRAYLSLVKNGDVCNKRSKFEDVERASIPARTAAKLYRMPDFDPEFVAKHLTDNTKVVIKTKEIADTNAIKRKLEGKSGLQQQQPTLQQQHQPEMSGSTFNLHSKDKLKHLCKKIGHSKILGKMVALQFASKTDVDDGTTKLWARASNEEEYLNVYRSGQVESKVHRFESKPRVANNGPDDPVEDLQQQQHQQPLWASGNSSNKLFSWSKRFESHLPNPSSSYTNAQKHNQFRKYYGYHPADAKTDGRSPSPGKKDTFQRSLPFRNQPQPDEPLSLPSDLNSHAEPPKPPDRKYMTLSSYLDHRKPDPEPIYGKILPKSQRMAMSADQAGLFEPSGGSSRGAD